jgi:hypothetical protein
LRLGRVTIERDLASRTESMRPGLSRVVLGDSTGLGLRGALVALRLGVALAGEDFWGLGAFTGLGELLVPLRLGGSGAWEVVFEALGLGGSLALEISSPIWGSFTGDFSLISCGVLH